MCMWEVCSGNVPALSPKLLIQSLAKFILVMRETNNGSKQKHMTVFPKCVCESHLEHHV